MLKAIFNESISNLTLKGLTQWDIGRTVEISCPSLPDSFQAHFASWDSTEAMIIECTASNCKATIPIPNILLQRSADFAMWVYIKDGDKCETKKRIIFSVEARAKPADYVYTEIEILNYEKLISQAIEKALLTADGTVVSQNADFAEVAEWADGNPDNEDRAGYFVCANIPVDGIVMKKATSVDDVKGVTIKNPAFAGNYTKDKLDSNGKLLPKYSYVAIIGFVPVIDNGTCAVGGRCMPDNNGCAIPSSNSMGYQVVNRIDEKRVLIIIEPNGDMVQRVKTKINELQKIIDGMQPGGDSNIFVVNFTHYENLIFTADKTKDEIMLALEEGKVLIGNLNFLDIGYFLLTGAFLANDNRIADLLFDGMVNGYYIYIAGTIHDNDIVWQMSNIDFDTRLEFIGNKVIDLNGNFYDDEHYPSARAVKNYVNDLIGNVETALDEIIALQNGYIEQGGE